MLDDYVKQRSGEPGVVDRYETLSDREREVFQLIAEGKTNKDIAAILFISPSTVETHRARIMEKLDVHSAAEIVLYAVPRGVTRSFVPADVRRPTRPHDADPARDSAAARARAGRGRGLRRDAR